MVELSGDILQLDGEGEHEGDQESQEGEAGVVSQVTQIVVTEATLHPWDFFAFLVMVIQFHKSDN